jgi:hypothetical protein
MSPLSKMSKGQDGKIEVTQFPTIESVQVCVEFVNFSLVKAYFEDKKTQQRFNVLALDDVVAVNIGLYNGVAWRRWVWMWESTQEADEAWSKAPADIDKILEGLVQKINDFIGEMTKNVNPENLKGVLDITPELVNIGWEMTMLERTIDDVAQEYRLSQKASGNKVE